MQKIYIHGLKSREHPESHLIDYRFTASTTDAAVFRTKEVAYSFLPQGTVKIELIDRRVYLIDKFEVEELSPGEFAISCMAPFEVPVKSATSSNVS